VLHHLFLLALAHVHRHQNLLQDVVVAVVFRGYFLPLLELLLELEIESEGFGVDLVEVGQEVLAEVLVVFVEGFEGQDAGDDEEDVGVAALHHFLEFLVFLGHAFDGA
jgi:hypothetical protein